MGLATAEDFLRLIGADGWRMSVLEYVRGLGLPDCWVGAGFVRSLIWDHLHGFARPTPLDDVDVIYFDATLTEPAADRIHEQTLAALWPQGHDAVPWSVKNQARMHLRNGDEPYRDTSDALCHWLETPTAVAVRLNGNSRLEFLAPLGIGDLCALRIAPTPHARELRPAAYRERVLGKAWTRQWPRVEVIMPPRA